MDGAPPPSVRCLLSQLPSRHVGDKVRFLGCVTKYSTHSAILTLQHDYPKGNKTKVNADVTLLLQNLKSEQTDIGQWVHVIGYITSFKQTSAKITMESDTAIVGVQVIILWTAEDLDISSYESTLISEPE